ncbi:unnamed protein product [Schistosoma curassoni]|uniref:Uncharacterized protein n=1 Tax=Schistosoma curassoni TaxID=6186 RepID=A0A183K8J8_9TREM|nr:unnamed protein product [Schistosoma curassoni]
MNDKKVPQFFIPASYKGHQTSPTPVSSNNLRSQNSTSINDTQHQRNLTNQLSTELNPNSPGIKFVNGKRGDQKQSLLFPSPTGTLDLSHYNFVPTQADNTNNTIITTNANNNKDTKSKRLNGRLSNQVSATNNRLNDTLIDNNSSNVEFMDSAQTAENGDKEKKRRRFRRPRKNSKLDRLIRFLEDKRVKDDGNGEELEDLQMPRLRKVLNIIFVTLGVCFLLAVIIVILYTTFAG